MPDTAPPADGSAITSSYLQTMVREQVVRTVTSSTRPAVVEGATAYETDTDGLIVSSTTGWSTLIRPAFGAWTTYTPTLTQSGAVTKTVTQAAYMRIGRLIIGYVKLDCTGAGTAANAVTVTAPVAMAGSIYTPLGSGHVYDASVTTWYPAEAVWYTSTTFALMGRTAGGVPLGAGDFTAALASGDLVGVSFAYQAASDA